MDRFQLHPLTNIFLVNSFPIFNLLVGFGLVMGILLFERNIRVIEDSKARKDNAIVIFCVSVIFAFCTANFLNWFIYPDLLQMPLISRVPQAGFTWYFGFFGFLLASCIIFSLKGYRYGEYLNAIVPSLTLFHACGRIGCSLGGCCYGKSISGEIFDAPIHFLFPAREIEAGLLFLLTIIFLTKIKQNRFILYAGIYAVFRFGIEFGRSDDRGQLFSELLSPSQEISVYILTVIVLVSAYRFFRYQTVFKL